MSRDPQRRSVGIVGCGAVGRFLYRRITEDADVARRLEVAFVYNRTARRLDDLPLAPARRLSGDSVRAALARWNDEHGAPDIVAEVSHPDDVADCGTLALAGSDLFVASLTALARPPLADALRRAAWANPGGHGLYLPAGAAWGVADVARLDRAGGLRGLTVTMTFNADALRLQPPLSEVLAGYRADEADREPKLLFDGPVAELAPLAPNNVNTMVCLALAGQSVGLDGTRARLLASKAAHAHVVDIDVVGPDGFEVHTRRVNPARPGAVTGRQTYNAFLASLLETGGRGNGVHFC